MQARAILTGISLTLSAATWGCSEPAPAPAEVPPDDSLPLELPFALSRPDVGQPLSAAEITAFTARITGLWKQIDYFTWVYETCHGMDASTGYPDYLIWWHDVDAVKEGDTVTFRHNSAYGGSHNNAQPTAVVLIQAIAAYLGSGDEAAARIVEQLAKSFTATMKGFVYDESDPLPHLMARNIVTHNHDFVLPSGKHKAVDYSDWYSTYEGWNANRYHYPDNPSWGDIYVTTMRSKDDVPYLYQAGAWFPYVLELGTDAAVSDAVAEALELLEAFAGDIAASGYQIRSKDAAGQAYIPEEDLASFVDYTALFPDAECAARLATALLSAGEPLGNDCGSGQGSPYERLAGASHYFNYAIINHFHLAALQLALTKRHFGAAQQLLTGLITRIEGYRDPATEEPGAADESWERDIAMLLLKGAALGLPLTSEEARLIQRYHFQSVDAYESFPSWDLWDPSVPDGTYDFRSGFHPAGSPEAIAIEEIAFLIEYCFSPFRNPAGADLVDCDVILDPDRW